MINDNATQIRRFPLSVTTMMKVGGIAQTYRLPLQSVLGVFVEHAAELYNRGNPGLSKTLEKTADGYHKAVHARLVRARKGRGKTTK